MKINFQQFALVAFAFVAPFALLFSESPLPPSHSHNSSLQLRGVMKILGSLRFSVHDVQAGHSRWVRIGSEAFGYRVTEYDEVQQRLLVQREGFRVWLSLETPGDEALEVAVSQAQDFEYLKNESSEGSIPFSSLSEEQQEAYFDPDYIPALRRSNIEVPRALILEANRQAAVAQFERQKRNREIALEGKSAKAGSSVASGGTVRRRGPTIPLVGNSLTKEEKAERAQRFQ